MAAKQRTNERPAIDNPASLDNPAALDHPPQQPAQAPAAVAPVAGRQNKPAPLCPIHKVACVSRNSSPYYTRYYCPDPGCSYSEKVMRPGLQRVLQRERDEEDYSAR